MRSVKPRAVKKKKKTRIPSEAAEKCKPVWTTVSEQAWMNSNVGYTVLIPDPLAMACLFIFLGHVWVLVEAEAHSGLELAVEDDLEVRCLNRPPLSKCWDCGPALFGLYFPQVWNTESHFVVTLLRAQNVYHDWLKLVVILSHPPRLGFRHETAPTPTFWLCLRLSLESHLSPLAPQLLIKYGWLIACSRGYTIYFTHDWTYCLGFICREVNLSLMQILVVCFIFITYSKDKYLTVMLKKYILPWPLNSCILS